MRTGCVYVIENLVNGKKYVGQTLMKPQQRWYAHFHSAENGSNLALARAIRKYGRDSFKCYVVYACTEPLLNFVERHFIASLATFGAGGYNLTSGGDFGGSVADSTKRKHSDRMKGFTHSKESRSKMSSSQLRRFQRSPHIVTEAQCAARSKRLRGVRPSEACMKAASKALTGRFVSEAERAVRSAAMTGRKFSDDHKAKIALAARRHARINGRFA